MDDKNKDFEEYVLPMFVESWINGFPMKTDFGYIKPLKIREFWKHFTDIELLKKQGWEVKKDILKYKDGHISIDQIKSDFDNHSFITCIRNNVASLRDEYTKIFKIFVYDFDDRVYWKMSQDDFDNFRKLILDFNHIYYYEKNPNPVIERYNKAKNFLASRKGGTIEFDTVFSTLMVSSGGGHLPEEINNLTIRQFYLAFKRVEFSKAHQTTTLFKTVDSKGY